MATAATRSTRQERGSIRSTTANADVQALNGTATLTDTFTALTADGTAQVVTITIAAQNDAAVITGDITGTVTEAGGVNNGTPGSPPHRRSQFGRRRQSGDSWQAVPAGATTNGYGSYALDATGAWTYTLDNSNATVQALNGRRHADRQLHGADRGRHQRRW